ncbi:MAG: DUF5688 family protein [Clostridiales bacterium]|nr:DUF5688 family protein [Clostridiales bacterium]
MSEQTNENMSFDEFCAYAENHIKEYLPDTYQDWKTKIIDLTRPSGEVKALTIRSPESNIAQMIYLDNFYSSYQQGRELPLLMKKISSMQLAYDKRFPEGAILGSNSMPEIMESAANWDSARESVLMEAVGCSKSGTMLTGQPHTRMGDLAVIYKVVLGHDTEDQIEIPITNQMLSCYGITLEELHEQAVKNTEKLYPAHLFNMRGLIETTMNISTPDNTENYLGYKSPVEETMLVLTNQKQAYGACVLFYPGILDQINSMCTEGFYIALSSVHESIIIPKAEWMDAECVDDMIKDINDICIRPEDQLSDYAHEYDPVSKTIYAPSLDQSPKLFEVKQEDRMSDEVFGQMPDSLEKTQAAAELSASVQMKDAEQQKKAQRNRSAR